MTVAGCATVIFVAWLALEIGGEFVTTAVDDIGEGIVAVVAGYACVRRARSEAGRLRRGWQLLGWGCLSWAAGEAVWSWIELVDGSEVPFPSLADAGYLLAVPLAFAAMLAFFSPPRGWTSRLRVVADGLIVGSSVLFVSWFLILGDLYHSSEGSLAARVIGLAYPAGDVVILSVVVLVGARTRTDDDLPLGWISAGIAAIAFSDTVFAYLTEHGSYSTGLLDAGWFAGFAMIAVAAARPAARGGSSRRRRGDLTVLPYVPVLAVLALAGGRAAAGDPLSGFLLGDACALFTFVVARQVLTLRENRSLAGELEARVATRTQQLHDSEERFRSLIQNVSDVISVIRPDGTIRYVSPSIESVFGYEPADIVNASLHDFIHPDDLPAVAAFLGRAHGVDRRLEVRVRHAQGGWRYTEAVGTDMTDEPALGGFVFTTRDVTHRRELEEQLAHQAFHDPLTGLANRALLGDRITHALSRIARTGRDLAVVFIDLDDFKAVNDTLGHAHGDGVLQEVARRLEGCVRPGDTVARMGGDEFAVLLEDAEEAVAVTVPERLAEALTLPVTLDGHDVGVSFSAGIARSGPDTKSAAEVLRNADVAMYQAKGAGKGRHEVFRPEMHEAVVQRVALVGEMRQALERGEFALHYQPLVELTTGRPVGFEALVRWHHPTRGLVPPVSFIPVAEETGLIVPLGRWILEEAVDQLVHWDGLRGSSASLTMSVNVSGRQLEHPDFVGTVAAVLEQSGIVPARLTLELTESVLLEDAEDTIARLHELKRLGVRLAIDDFGTGFSSLSYLQRFPVDTLKVDKTFVDDLDSPRGAELARTLIELGGILGLDTVAEGIEDPTQARLLEADGCRLGQGYVFSRPMPPHRVTEYLSRPVAPHG